MSGRSSSRSAGKITRQSESSASDSEEEEKLIVVKRPKNYWINLYKRSHKIGLKKVVNKLVTGNINLFRDIIIAHEYQAEAVQHVAPDEVLPSHWIISYDADDNTIAVADYSDAQLILDSWQEFQYFPDRLPNGEEIPKVKTFDQLIAVMTQINPYLFLEMAAYSLSGKDFGRSDPNREYSYDATPEQIEQIRDDLEKLRDSLNSSK